MAVLKEVIKASVLDITTYDSVHLSGCSHVKVTNKQGNSFHPDWMIYNGYSWAPEDCTRLVVGDSKLSTKWQSAWLLLEESELPQDPDEKKAESQKTERMWPIRQLASYCIWGGTCYRFLITPEELVAVRIY